MGISNTSTPFDQIVEKVTDEKSKEDWGLIMEVINSESKLSIKQCT